MGQQFGRPSLHIGVKSFVSLPLCAVEDLVGSYKLLSDGWAITPEAWAAICNRANLSHHIEIKGLKEEKSLLEEISMEFFQVLDTDRNGLVDALELLGTISMISGMDPSKKIKYIFGCRSWMC